MTAGTVAEELELDRARAAARSGDLDGALALLGGDSPAALDLRARVHAQRGEFAEADAAWARVLAADPSHEGAAVGRKAIAGRATRRVVTAGGTALVVVVLLAGSALLISRPDEPSSASAPVTPVATAPAAPATSSAPPSSAPSPSASVADRLLRVLAVDGVTVRAKGAAAEVVFDQGLFVRGDALRGDARATLDRVGRALRGGGDVTVTVVGHAVPVTGGRTAGGSTTALARAQVAAARLSRASGLPLTSFRLVSADQQEGPHDTPEGNRTVTLLVEPPA
ncbi:tetratricopeptide repeat protein [Actinoplanes philippinensis]|uniref:tetratricopeptide repeat protein n=1 Tax=Actinoplanes philippinensis TaxID=35752 RepID=UPI0033FA3E52